MKIAVLLLILPAMLIAALSADVTRIMAGDDVIGYIHGQQIYIMDVATQEEAKLSHGIGAEDFCWDRSGKKLFFLSMNGETSTLTGYSLGLLTMDKVRLFSKTLTPQEGFDGPVDYYNSKIYLTASFDLLVEVGFGWYFSETELYYQYSFQKKSLTQISEHRDKPELLKPLPGMDSMYSNQDIKNQYVDGHYELYIRKTVSAGDKGKTVWERLTNTNRIERYDGAEEDEMDFVLSPDQKQILFGFSTSYGDLMHGETHIINIDGSSQHPVSLDYQLGNDLAYTWTKDSKLIYIDSDNGDQYDDGAGWSSVLKIRDKEGRTAVLKKASEHVHSLHYRH